MRYLIKNKKVKELVILSIIYCMAHWMLLVVSGRWWDDWCTFNQPFSTVIKMALELGRPFSIVITWFAKLLPEAGYRIVTFILYYYCMLFLYKALRMWLDLNDEDCFWICALYSVIPVNDARIMLCIFPYTIGLFFFMAGMISIVAKT